MGSHLVRLAGLAALSVMLMAANEGRTVISIYVYDLSTMEYIEPTVTVSYSAGNAVTSKHSRFILPASVTAADVTIEEPGYCSLDTTISLTTKHRVGGQGFFFGLWPCEAASTVTR